MTRRRLPKIQIPCKECGTEFEVFASQEGRKKFCTYECSQIWRKKNITKESIYEKHVIRAEGENDCWGWKGGTSPFGYGAFKWQQHYYSAHRTAYEIYVGPIPEDKNVLHKCDNPPCSNPNHLFIGTDQDNTVDAFDKGRRDIGENHYWSRLSDEDINEIRTLYGYFTNDRIAAMYDITPQYVGALGRGKKRTRPTPKN